MTLVKTIFARKEYFTGRKESSTNGLAFVFFFHTLYSKDVSPFDKIYSKGS
jgi:hypothetical protein